MLNSLEYNLKIYILKKSLRNSKNVLTKVEFLG